jgi:hypothetical protein
MYDVLLSPHEHQQPDALNSALQGAMRQLLDLKGPAKLSDEVQWSIRMLLPKPGLPVGSSPAITPAAGDGTSITNALTVLADHAQQVHGMPQAVSLFSKQGYAMQ